MESRRGAVVLAVIGVAVAVALFFVLKDDEETPAPATTTEAPAAEETKKPETERDKPPKPTRIELTDGQPVGGVAEIEVAKGEEIVFEVSSDIDDEIHMHGYDVTEDVAAGRSVTFKVPATIEGVFEVESHHGAAQIAEVTVTP
jgi:hypothetical protein